MRVSSRAVIIENGKVLTMFRRRISNGIVKEYNALPGGGQEGNETLEENVKRELREEMNVEIEILGYLGKKVYENREDNFFACSIKEGTPHLGGEELDKNCPENYYEPMWVETSSNGLGEDSIEMINKAIQKQYN